MPDCSAEQQQLASDCVQLASDCVAFEQAALNKELSEAFKTLSQQELDDCESGEAAQAQRDHGAVMLARIRKACHKWEAEVRKAAEEYDTVMTKLLSPNDG